MFRLRFADARRRGATDDWQLWAAHLHPSQHRPFALHRPFAQHRHATALIRSIVMAGAMLALLITASESRAALHDGPRATRTSAEPTQPRVQPNDNRHPAGVTAHDTMTVVLDAQRGVWHPDGPTGDSVTVAAFGEPGKPLSTPGPLLRIALGTPVRVTVRNRLAVPLTMHGLGTERGVNGDSVRIAAGASHDFAFRATGVGTFYYAATTGRAPVIARSRDDSQLHGAIVVDSNRTPIASTDRVFMISWWYQTDTASRTGLTRATMAINGLAWPHTERIDVAQGDSLRWRWINLTLIDHPLHLHGFYFRVDGDGNGSDFTRYTPVSQRQAVTENLHPGATIELAWSPTRPGNWLFHCHMASHMSHLVNLSTRHPERADTAREVGAQDVGTSHVGASRVGEAHVGEARVGESRVEEARVGESHVTDSHDALQHAMGGLVLGIRVAPREAASRAVAPHNPRSVRPIRLVVKSKAGVFGRYPGYRYTLGADGSAADTSAFGGPGATMVLRQNEPVAVTIVNRSHAPTAVHWHGIELESFPDGVPGWSGIGHNTLPAVAPRESITVRFTPPRAGTFMYHSHFNEMQQIASGLFGAILVLPAGTRWNPETDRTLIFSDDGPTDDLIRGPYPAPRLNGSVSPAPMLLTRGTSYRLRLINIRTDYTMSVALRGAAGVAPEWTIIAKDGATLPVSHVHTRSAALQFAPGEIYDVEFTPRVSGEYELEYRRSEQSPVANPTGRMRVIVR